MSAETAVQGIHVVDIGTAEQRRHGRAPDHIHEDEMLLTDEVHMAGKGFGQHRIAEIGKDYQQGASAQVQPDKRGNAVEVRAIRF